MPRYRNLLLAFALAGCAAGLLLGGRAPVARAEGAGDYLRTFAQILDIVETRYVDEVPSEDLIVGAIRGMLHTLDPHSNFLERRAYKEMREEQKGSFSGLGIVISLRGDENLLTVISPIEGTPAYRAGIRAGDVIAEIEGKDTIGMSIDDALSKLRGPKGTQVSIKIRREGYDELIPFTIVRDDIPTNSIQYAYMIRPGVGYIRIKNFTQTTSRELEEKLAELKGTAMEKLILDLRGNPGGLLEQAVKVTSHFLPEGEKIVFTRGRNDRSNEEYLVPREGEHLDLPMVVLINRGSASASEIVAGALQDHDRALVVGESSWGKGLVQTVYNLSSESALALTTARYYTPSGRLIQRDYRSLEDYFAPATDEEGNAGSRDVDQDPEKEPSEMYNTDAGRKVFGGGGIHPDVRVSVDEISKYAEVLERRSTFFEFATRYRAAHPAAPDQDSFQVEDAILAEYRAFLAEKKIDAKDEDFGANLDYIKRALRAEVIANYYGLVPRNRILSEGDRQLQGALQHFAEAERLAEMRAAALRARTAVAVPN